MEVIQGDRRVSDLIDQTLVKNVFTFAAKYNHVWQTIESNWFL